MQEKCISPQVNLVGFLRWSLSNSCTEALSPLELDISSKWMIHRDGNTIWWLKNDFSRFQALHYPIIVSKNFWKSFRQKSSKCLFELPASFRTFSVCKSWKISKGRNPCISPHEWKYSIISVRVIRQMLDKCTDCSSVRNHYIHSHAVIATSRKYLYALDVQWFFLRTVKILPGSHSPCLSVDSF